ncbi:hypothetical protein [Paenibacillus sp. HB172176]|uniref:hypothetical protein n=1 Tax=Paenibacillus sp. HB172176 TaxID=2493690 RepID=UPI00143AE2C7|nr:hypothetical protein [Paenibacillus sp. HB172176]
MSSIKRFDLDIVQLLNGHENAAPLFATPEFINVLGETVFHLVLVSRIANQDKIIEVKWQGYHSTTVADRRYAISSELAVFVISRTESTLFSKKLRFILIFEEIRTSVSAKLHQPRIFRE